VKDAIASDTKATNFLFIAMKPIQLC
jgi:hypothetical protein